MDKIRICKICSIEVNKSLLFDHINSKEHKDIEKFFIMKYMTYCESSSKEIKIDEWREHVNSEKHLEFEGKNYCDICKKKYSIEKGYSGTFQVSSESAKRNHAYSDIHKLKEERTGFCSS